ncbi:MAG: DinB family protein [Saprospiraceae bacterium]|nr:DinB family protein [Saprospiraceae bacterium]
MSIQSNLTITIQNRKAFKKILDSLSIEQINKIPQGFNNNIIWNAAHVLSIQQMLTYALGNLPFTLPKDQILEFNMGTRPQKEYVDEFIDQIKSQFFSTHDQLVQDISENKFETFNPFMTAIKVEVINIETAIAFNQYHEALHMGYMLNIRRFL